MILLGILLNAESDSGSGVRSEILDFSQALR